MNDYITYDGKKYKTVAKNWQPQHHKPVTARYMADGMLDVSFGNGVIKTFKGEIVADPNETRVGYGKSSDLETSLDKLQNVIFIDHDGNSHTNTVCKGYKRRSLSPNWASTKHYYEVELLYT
jgi:hypothetical protein